MATTTPEIQPQEATKKAPIMLTPKAIAKVKEIMGQQNPVPAGLRVGVVDARQGHRDHHPVP